MLMPPGEFDRKGVTRIACSAADETVTFSVAVLAPEVAVTLAGPETTVISPAGVTLTAVGADEFQETTPVTSRVLPSLKLAKARNCCRVFRGSDNDDGVIDSPVRLAESTNRLVEAATVPTAAVIVVDPPVRPVATPDALIEATPVLEEVQDAVLVTSALLPSLKVPIARNCTVIPTLLVGRAGDMTTDTSVACGCDTVRLVDPETEPEVAVIVVVPAAKVAASPAPLIVATVCAEDDQVTVVRAWVCPSLNVPVAVNCWLVPVTSDGFTGETAIEDSVGEGGVGVELLPPPPPPQPIHMPIRAKEKHRRSLLFIEIISRDNSPHITTALNWRTGNVRNRLPSMSSKGASVGSAEC
jgi:hypothetical protein